MDPTIVRAARENHLEWMREQARWSGPAGRIQEGDGLLLAASSTTFPVAFNSVVRTDPTVPASDVLAAADAWFGAQGRGYTVSTIDLDGADEDLRVAAASAGFAAVGQPPEMVLGSPIDGPAAVPGVDIVPVADAAGLAGFHAVCSDAYGTIGMPAGIVESAITDLDRFTAPWTHTVVAWRDGLPLAAAQVLLSHGIAGVYWVGTVAAARGSGLGEAVTRTVTAWAFAAGAAAVTLQASPQGEPIYARLGFETVYRCSDWARLAPPAG